MTADELIALNDQIAGMAKAGLPLDQGLAGLAREMGRGRLRSVTAAIADDLRAGTPLPEAVERRRADLPPFYAHLVTAGIRTGRLPEVLATLTAYARTVAVTRAIVVESLFYPAVVLSLATILLGGLVFFIVPQFDQLFNDFHMRLPWITEWVLRITRYPIPIFAVPVAVVATVFLTWLVTRWTPAGRRAWARLVYSVPVVGTLVRSARLAAFADLLSVLVEYEMPLPDAFRLAGQGSSDPLMAGRAGAVADRLATGIALAPSLRDLGLLPEWVIWMAGSGEQRGALAAALRQIAAVYRRQVEARAALLRSVLPAFAIIGTAGVLVAVFVLSVMVPMIKLIEGLMR
ncbi:MAG TPA: type II secretion system F family protein [Gemmataceae bacterium]|jgi:type II secretory pathway component PulF